MPGAGTAATANALTSIVSPTGVLPGFHLQHRRPIDRRPPRRAAPDRSTYSYDSGEVTVTDAAGDASRYLLRAKGTLVKTIDALGNVTLATFDSNGNLTSLTGPTGLTDTFTYDANGNLTSGTDPLGHTTTYTYTGTDNPLASVTDPQGDTTSYGYNSSGDLTSIQTPDDAVGTAIYDALGDPLSLTNPDGQVTSYTYNAAGQVASVTLAGAVDDHVRLRRPGQPDHGDLLVGRHDGDLRRVRPGHLRLLSRRPVPALHV